MPTYDYLCEECGETFELKATVAEYSAGLEAHCPSCGSERAIRTFSGIGISGAARDGGTSGPICGPGAGPGCCG